MAIQHIVVHRDGMAFAICRTVRGDLFLIRCAQRDHLQFVEKRQKPAHESLFHAANVLLIPLGKLSDAFRLHRRQRIHQLVEDEPNGLGAAKELIRELLL